jgi:signal transduction histidine kinase
MTTIRMRLTLLYAGAFFLAGLALIALTYIYLRHSLDWQLEARVEDAEQHLTSLLAQPETHEGTHTRAQIHDTLRAQFEQNRADTLRAMLIWSLASLGVAGVAAGALGWLLAGRALQTLRRITATARRVADRSLHERIALHGPDDEIKDLADTFDAMLERLDRSFDSQRRFVANAAHELHTPLTINRTMIEVALEDPDTPEPMRQLGTSLLTVNQRHERLIDGMLLLATSEQPLTDLAAVDLADIAAQTVAAFDQPARHARVEIRTDLSSAPVVGDAVLLERLAHNLLDNAIRYNLNENGWVAITTGASDGNASLTVENTGPLVPGKDIDALFEPFRRLATTDRITNASRGSGLGLSIVRAIAQAHHGHVQTQTRADGGLSVQVRLPIHTPI